MTVGHSGRGPGSLIDSITKLALALEERDRYTSGHSERVAGIAMRIARGLGLPPEQVEKIRLSGLVHDIGKIGIRASVLTKRDVLSDEEFCHIASHSLLGESILRAVIDDEDILQIVRHHHERYDGQGYPDGIAGRNIHLGSRILAVADMYDAMTSDRPYRKAVDHGIAMEELKRQANVQLDPEIVDVFMKITVDEAKKSRSQKAGSKL
jgi:putative two-component system response regulator